MFLECSLRCWTLLTLGMRFHTTALFGLLLPSPRGRPLATNPNNLLQRAKAPDALAMHHERALGWLSIPQSDPGT
jgi:hypothetical protein